jgi:hypothetical protein
LFMGLAINMLTHSESEDILRSNRSVFFADNGF